MSVSLDFFEVEYLRRFRIFLRRGGRFRSCGGRIDRYLDVGYRFFILFLESIVYLEV